MPLDVGKQSQSNAENPVYDDDILWAVFSCFDVDRSGGISLDELQACAKVLGLTMSPIRIADAFGNADVDNSGYIDFEEFKIIAADADGGAFAKMIEKVQMDKATRDIMKSRCRPETVISPLEEQLAETRATREWLSGFHLNNMENTVKAAASPGFLTYRPEASVQLNRTSPFARTSLSSPSEEGEEEEEDGGGEPLPDSPESVTELSPLPEPDEPPPTQLPPLHEAPSPPPLSARPLLLSPRPQTSGGWSTLSTRSKLGDIFNRDRAYAGMTPFEAGMSSRRPMTPMPHCQWSPRLGTLAQPSRRPHAPRNLAGLARSPR